jgi:ribosomal protein S27AE
MEADGEVVHVERVCCLECGANYVRPADESTTRQDTGCPRCGYPGWIFAVVPTSAA